MRRGASERARRYYEFNFRLPSTVRKPASVQALFIHTYVCVSVSICLGVNSYVCIHVNVCVRVDLCAALRADVYVDRCICVSLYLCMRVCKYLGLCVYMYAYRHAHEKQNCSHLCASLPVGATVNSCLPSRRQAYLIGTRTYGCTRASV